MRRREFVALLGGAAAAWPLAATRAQQGARMPRIGVLFAARVGKDTSSKFVEPFTKSLLELGWVDGQTIKIDYRFADYDVAQAQVLARELINLKPDVILAINTLVVAAFQHETKSVPIVFVAVTDPVASGFVANLSHPGGNITGFSNFEPTLVAKHIEILKEISPGMTTVLDMFNPDINLAYLASIYPVVEAAAQYHSVQHVAAPVRSDADIERVISGLRDKSTTGLIVAGEPFLRQRLDLIVSLTTRYRIPSVFAFRPFAEGGGLISYWSDLIEQYRQAAVYIDRIVKGANPANLPVQLPTKFEMVINLKTAKAMGLTLPPALLGRADEVIE
jgi:putative tryptophan/tyrosine transport system substrate-binding protein